MTVMLACGLKKEEKNLYTLNRENGVVIMGSTSSIADSNLSIGLLTSCPP